MPQHLLEEYPKEPGRILLAPRTPVTVFLPKRPGANSSALVCKHFLAASNVKLEKYTENIAQGKYMT